MRRRWLVAAFAAFALAACDAGSPTPELPAATDRGWSLIFFAHDSADLSAQARTSLNHTVAVALERPKLNVHITAHTDRSGSSAYNMALSRRRAEAIRDELVRLGVPTQRIKLEWRGESQNLVETNDGVREPQNRRADAHVW